MDENRKSDKEIEWEIFVHETQKQVDKEAELKNRTGLELWVPRVVSCSLLLFLLPIGFLLAMWLLLYLSGLSHFSSEPF